MNNTYNTEIISVGSELLLGHVTNTDARDVSEMLSKIGINVRYHTVVGDNPERLRQCVKIARGRADIIITTGGLGPTCDDLTKQILAECFGLKLIENRHERDTLYNYINYSSKFSENNYLQAMLPEGCTVFHNTCGTAPGCAFEKDGCTVIMLPGPPKECRTMMEVSGIPYLKKFSGGEIVSHSVRVFGLSESGVDEIFRDEMNAMTNPTMAPYAKECDCLVQLTAKADSEAEGEELLKPLIAHVCEKLGDVVYGIDDEDIESAVLRLLKDRPLTFALAEQCTGGAAAARFTAVEGDSGFLKGSVSAFDAKGFKAALGMDADEDIISEKTAKEAAEAVRRLYRTDLGLAFVGAAGQNEAAAHQVGTAYVAMADRANIWVRPLTMGPHRSRSFVRQLAGNHGYDMMRRYLTGKPIIR